jgi:hypothetical protein
MREGLSLNLLRVLTRSVADDERLQARAALGGIYRLQFVLVARLILFRSFAAGKVEFDLVDSELTTKYIRALKNHRLIKQQK